MKTVYAYISECPDVQSFVADGIIYINVAYVQSEATPSPHRTGVVELPNTSSSYKTICPFYIKDADKSITCEGLIKGTSDMRRFQTTKVKREYQEHVCQTRDYAYLCPIAEALTAMYERQWNEQHSRAKRG